MVSDHDRHHGWILLSSLNALCILNVNANIYGDALEQVPINIQDAFTHWQSDVATWAHAYFSQVFLTQSV